MDPTLNLGDIVAATASYGAIRRGDVVVLTSSPATAPAFAGVSDLMKRVVGLPGDTIESTTTQQITVNGQVLDEPYLAPGTVLGPPIPQQTVPTGHYFVLGDSRTDSTDSRFFGPITAAQIVAVVTGIISPPDRIRAIAR